MILLELARQTGLSPKWKSNTAGGEYFSPCPSCGGKDRFYLQPHKKMSKCIGYYRCRQCNACGDAIKFAREFLHLSFTEAAEAAQATISNIPAPTIEFKPTFTTLQKPPELWIDKATEFVLHSYQQLILKEEMLEYLHTRGISIETINHYKIGWNNKPQYISRPSWGLDHQVNANGETRSLWIPRGIVIPCMESKGSVVRLKIRRWEYNDTLPKYIAISGSMNGLNIIGDQTKNVMIVVESELDAYAIESTASDIAFVISVGSNIKNPDNLTDYLAKKAENLLICHDNDEAGKKMLLKWKRLYNHAKACPTPIGKDIGNAIEKGLDIRQWILQST
jgi:DNA primase